MAITYTNQDGTKRTEYAGRVVGTRFHAAYDDDYNYAIVVDEAGEDREVLIFTTAFACGDEGWPSVEVDAPAEILAAREAKMALAAEIAAAKVKKARPNRSFMDVGPCGWNDREVRTDRPDEPLPKSSQPQTRMRR